MEVVLAFIGGMTVIGVLFTANRAIDAWKASVVPNPAKDPELDAVRVALSRFDPEAALESIDALEKRVAQVEATSIERKKLVDLYERMNVLSVDMVEVKAAVLKLRSGSNFRSLLGGKSEASGG